MAFTNASPEHVSRLPIHRPPLLGRERELTTLSRLLTQPEVPLVTLTGPGGVGKTRLAIHAAAQIREVFDDDVLFVALETVRDPAVVTQAIAQSAGIVMHAKSGALDTLRRHFRERNCLLLLDNFEQLIEGSGDLDELISACPRLTLLVTSRESLRISQEQEFPVRPLSLTGRNNQPDTVPTDSPAVELFIQRARAVDPDLDFDENERAVIAELCARLDGLPLAIELAAARIKLLTPNLMLDRLDDRFGLLSRDARGLPQRLRSMRDTICWSYELLTEQEQRLFRWLSVFRGGFTIAAAEAVCGVSVGTPGNYFVLDGLHSLIDKSLVIPLEHSANHDRFGMLETIRAYAREQLTALGEFDAAHAAMSTWIRALIGPAQREQFGSSQPKWTHLLEQEHANLCAALEWNIDRGDTETAGALIYAAVGSWHTSGRFSEGRVWAERALASADGASAYVTGCLQHVAGWMALYEGSTSAALEYMILAEVSARSSGDSFLLAHVLLGRCSAYDLSGEFNLAESLFDEMIPIFERCSATVWLPHARNHLGHIIYETGRIDEAAVQFDRALAEFRALGNTFGEAAVLTNLAKVARKRGDYDGSIGLFRQSLGLRWDHGDRMGMVGCLRGLGTAHTLAGHAEFAVRLFAACDVMRDSIGLPPVHEHSTYWHALEQARTTLDRSTFDRAWEIGRTCSIGSIVAEAMNTSPMDATPQRRSHAIDLTPREIEVLSLIRTGCSNRAIADRLFISERTAQTHVQHILDKLDVSTRAAAAARAVELEIA